MLDLLQRAFPMPALNNIHRNRWKEKLDQGITCNIFFWCSVGKHFIWKEIPVNQTHFNVRWEKGMFLENNWDVGTSAPDYD